MLFENGLTSSDSTLQFVHDDILKNGKEAEFRGMTESGLWEKPLQIVNVVVKCASTKKFFSLREDTANNTKLRAFIGTKSFRNQTHTVENPHGTLIVFGTGSEDSQGSSMKIAGMLQILRYNRYNREQVNGGDVSRWYEPHECSGMFIQNIVARMNLGFKIDIRKVSSALDISYAITDVFPGLNVSSNSIAGDHTVNVFETGYVGITGTSDMIGMIALATRLRKYLVQFCENDKQRERLLREMPNRRYEIPPSPVFVDKNLIMVRRRRRDNEEEEAASAATAMNVDTLAGFLSAFDDDDGDDDDDTVPLIDGWSERVIEMTLHSSEHEKREHALLSMIFVVECRFEEYYSLHRPFLVGSGSGSGSGSGVIIPFEI